MKQNLILINDTSLTHRLFCNYICEEGRYATCDVKVRHLPCEEGTPFFFKINYFFKSITLVNDFVCISCPFRKWSIPLTRRCRWSISLYWSSIFCLFYDISIISPFRDHTITAWNGKTRLLISIYIWWEAEIFGWCDSVASTQDHCQLSPSSLTQ